MKIDVIPESIISPLEVEAINNLFQFYHMFPQEIINYLFVVQNLVCLLSLTHDLMPYINLVIAEDVMTSAKHSCTVCKPIFLCGGEILVTWPQNKSQFDAYIGILLKNMIRNHQVFTKNNNFSFGMAIFWLNRFYMLPKNIAWFFKTFYFPLWHILKLGHLISAIIWQWGYKIKWKQKPRLQ